MAQVVGKDTTMAHRVTCRECASIIEYRRSELQERKHTDYTGDTDIWKVIVCPSCNADISVRT